MSRQGDVNEVYTVTLTGGFRFFVYGEKIVHTGNDSLWIYDMSASSTIQVNGLTYIYDEPQFFETGFCCYSNSSLYFIRYDGTFERIMEDTGYTQLWATSSAVYFFDKEGAAGGCYRYNLDNNTVEAVYLW